MTAQNKWEWLREVQILGPSFLPSQRSAFLSGADRSVPALRFWPTVLESSALALPGAPMLRFACMDLSRFPLALFETSGCRGVSRVDNSGRHVVVTVCELHLPSVCSPPPSQSSIPTLLKICFPALKSPSN